MRVLDWVLTKITRAFKHPYAEFSAYECWKFDREMRKLPKADSPELAALFAQRRRQAPPPIIQGD